MVDCKQAVQDNPEAIAINQTLSQHSSYVENEIKCIAKALNLKEFEDALVTAAQWHDYGKNRPIWQYYVCNEDKAVPLGKSAKHRIGRILGGYRHEFGSLIDADLSDALKIHPERDLIMHLLAAHHGWARPYFEKKAWDQKHSSLINERVTSEVMQRFGRLQLRFGRWTLAWIESLLRCADIAASKQSNIKQEEPLLKEVIK